MNECKCDDFEKNEKYVLNYIENNIDRYKNGITREQFSGIIGARISAAEGAICKNGILKEHYSNANDYALAIMKFKKNKGSNNGHDTAQSRFEKMMQDTIVKCFIYCWLIRNYNNR